MIHRKVKENAWMPILVVKNGPAISHIFFADDLFLFAEANVSQARIIKKVMDIFGSASGHNVNSKKTEVLVLNALPMTKVLHLLRILHNSCEQHRVATIPTHNSCEQAHFIARVSTIEKERL